MSEGDPLAYVALTSHGLNVPRTLQGRPDVRDFSLQSIPKRVVLQSGPLTAWILFGHWGISEAAKTAIEEIEPGVHDFSPVESFQSSVRDVDWEYLKLEADQADFSAATRLDIRYYAVGNLPILNDAIDKNNSSGSWTSIKGRDGNSMNIWAPAFTGPSPICLYRDKIAGKHLFCCDRTNSFYISQCLHRHLHAVGALTGLDLLPCRAS
jgi:hypothetical protein